MARDTLDIILPAYSEAAGIEAVFRDLLSLEDRVACDIRLIIVDDGSQDDSGKICLQLSERNRKIRYIRHEKNRDYGSAITPGINAATGLHVAIFDADGQFRSGDLLRLYRETDPYAAVVGFRKKWLRRDFSA